MMNILIIDDDRFTRKKVEALLTREGFTVRSTDDWAEITRIIAQDSIDVILMDVEMPHLRGDRIASVIMKTVQNPPHIFLHSSLDPAELDRRAREIGVDGYIPKGLTGPEYAERIDAAMTKRGSFDGAHLGFVKDGPTGEGES